MPKQVKDWASNKAKFTGVNRPEKDIKSHATLQKQEGGEDDEEAEIEDENSYT